MPSLYGNVTYANVSAGNTISLYGQTSAAIPNNATELLNLLSNNGTVDFALDPVTGNVKVLAYANAAGLYGNANVSNFLGSNSNVVITTTGDITTSGSYYGDGSNLTGVAGDYGDSNVAAFLPTYTGNVGSGAGYIFGNGSQLTGVVSNSTITLTGDVSGTGTTGSNIATTLATVLANTGSYGSSNTIPIVTTDAKGRITDITEVALPTLDNYGDSNVVTLLSSFGSNTVATTGNITAGYFLGNGSQLTGLPESYTNANVVSLLAAFGSNTVSTTGNITAGYFLGNGSQLTGLPESYSNVNVAAYLPTYTGNLGGTLTTAAQPNITSLGTLTGLTLSGTLTGTTLEAAQIGNAGATITGATVEAATIGNSGTTLTGTLSTASQPNVTSLGTLTGLTLSGTLTGTALEAAAIGNAGAALTGTVQTAAQPNINELADSVTMGEITIGSNAITSTHHTITIEPYATGNTGNVVIEGNLRVTGNITYIDSNVITVNDKNITLANNQTTLLGVDGGGLWLGDTGGAPVVDWVYDYTANNWSTGFGITAQRFVGNGSTLTDITAANVTGTVAAAGVAEYVTQPTQSNITAVGTLTSLTVSGNANVQSNLSVTSTIVVGAGAGGNIAGANIISANYFVGDGSLLTNIGGLYSNSNVVALLASFGSNVVDTTGNITAGYFIGNGSQLTGIPESYTDANVVSLLAAFGSNTITTTGDITANSFIGDGSQLTGIPDSYTDANVVTLLAAFGSNTITTAGNVTAGNVIGTNVSAGSLIVGTGTGGNITGVDYITANFFVGDGGLLTNVSANTYGDSNVAAFLAAFGSNAIETTGNVSAGYFIGDGSLLTALTGANVSGTVANATYADSAGSADTATTATYVTGLTSANVTTALTYTPLDSNATAVAAGTAEFVTNATQANITSVGTLTGLTLSGTLTGTTVEATTIGNTGAAIIGDGSALTNITAANITGTVANATYADSAGSADTATTATYVTGLTSANVTTALGYTPTDYGDSNVAAYLPTYTGNITAGNILTDNYLYANGDPFIPSGGSTYGDSNVAALLASFGSNAISTTGNVEAGQIVSNQFTGSAENTASTTGYAQSLTGTVTQQAAVTGTTNRVRTHNIQGIVDLNGYDNTGLGTSAGGAFVAVEYTNGNASLSTITEAAGITALPFVQSTPNLAITNMIAVKGQPVTVSSTTAITNAVCFETGFLAVGGGSFTNKYAFRNQDSSAIIDTAGDVQANVFIGNGSALTNITGANVVGSVSDATTAQYVTGLTSSNVTTALGYTPTNYTDSNVASYLPTYTGNLSPQNVQLIGFQETYANLSYSATITPNVANASIQYITLTGGLTFNQFENALPGQSLTLIVTQDGTGGHTLTSNMKFAGNTRTLSTDPNAEDIISVFYSGQGYYASLTKGYL